MKIHPLVLLCLIISFTLSACNLGAPAPQDGSAIYTAAAQTIEAVLTSPAASPTAAQTAATPIPGVAIDGTTAEPPSTNCEENYLITLWERNGVTYDKTEVDKALDPNEGFEMTWKIKNTGSCTWTDGYDMVFDSGERITPVDSFNPIPLGQIVPPGSEMFFSVPMAAPSAPGTYETPFRLDNAEGQRVLFIGVLTTVGKADSNVSGLTAPGDLRYSYDCSGGVTRITLTWQDKANNEEGYRIYRDGIQIAEVSAGTTVYDDIVPAPGSYQYTIAAYNKEGESTSSMQAVTSNCN